MRSQRIHVLFCHRARCFTAGSRCVTLMRRKISYSETSLILKSTFNTMVADDEGALWMRFGSLEGSTQSERLIIETSTSNVVAGRPYVTSSTVAPSWLLENFNREGCCQ